MDKHIKKLRKQLNMSQTEFGEKVGVSPMAVSRWEAGVVIPEAGFLIKIAKLTGTSKDFWHFLGAAGLSQSDLAKKRA